MQDFLSGKRASDQWMTAVAYSEEYGIFLLDDNSVGFMYEMEPLTGGDEGMHTRCKGLYNLDWPVDTIVQTNLIVLDNIHEIEREIQLVKSGGNNPLVARVAERSREFLMRGVREPLIRSLGMRPRNGILTVSAKIPIKEYDPSDDEVELAIKLRSNLYETLSTIGFHGVQPVDDSRYVHIMSMIINRGHFSEWRRQPTKVDRTLQVREEVMNPDSVIEIEKDRLRIGGKTVATVLSPKRLPPYGVFGMARFYGGDPMTGSRGIPGNYIISGAVQILPQLATKDKLSASRTWITRSADSGLVKFKPEIRTRYNDINNLFSDLESGDRVQKTWVSITLLAETDDELDRAVSKVQPYWSELGFSVYPEMYITAPCFFHSLPFGPIRQATKDFHRYRTQSVTALSMIQPFMSEWKGTRTPLLTLFGRSGQVMSFSPFDSSSNYNVVISATSGAGKSFLTNEIIMSILAAGGRVWVIDAGRSYEKLCEALGGQFISFEPEKTICLNPFDTIRDERTFEEMQVALINLITSMAAPKEGIGDFTKAALTRILSELWRKHRHELTIDILAEELKRQKKIEKVDARGNPEVEERLVDLGQQLYAYTTEGAFGRYFNGPSTISFDADFVVLELDDLKPKRDLMNVVLLQLISLIQQAMFLGNKGIQKAVIIDEAWDLLLYGDQGVKAFAETGFRTFRKYNGSGIVVTQSIADLQQNATGKAIADNAETSIMLAQKPGTIEALYNEGKLAASRALVEIMKSIHTAKGSYSEMLIQSSFGTGVARLIVDPYRQLLYSSDPNDRAAIEVYIRRGMPIEDAIEQVLRDRGKYAGPKVLEATNSDAQPDEYGIAAE